MTGKTLGPIRENELVMLVFKIENHYYISFRNHGSDPNEILPKETVFELTEEYEPNSPNDGSFRQAWLRLISAATVKAERLNIMEPNLAGMLAQAMPNNTVAV